MHRRGKKRRSWNVSQVIACHSMSDFIGCGYHHSRGESQKETDVDENIKSLIPNLLSMCVLRGWEVLSREVYFQLRSKCDGDTNNQPVTLWVDRPPWGETAVAG